MKNLIPTLLVIVITILSCNPSEPENNQEITLKVEDVSCIEARLNIQTNNISLPVQINLTANSSLINQFTLTTSDSLIVIDSLQPNSSYTFQATISNNISSNSVNAVTMDTTSHDFNWQTFTFGGDGGSSYLKDVAIINENNIWAVGEIYENGEKYNAVQWNGIAWKLRKILVNFRGDSIFLPLEGIRAFAESDIWLVGSLPIHGNGKIWTVYDVRKITNSDLSLSQAWGHSSEDIYFVGRSGSIAHYDGNNWRKIESGTNLDVYDIWGDYNEQTGEYAILAVAAKLLHSADRDILKIAKNGVEKIDETGIDWSLRGIWFKSGRKYYAVGSGIYFKSSLESNEPWDESLSGLTNYYTHSIRGKDLNDIFICGAYNEVLHFNGKTWKSLRGSINSSETGRLTKVAYDGKTCCIVGSNDGKAILYLGKR